MSYRWYKKKPELTKPLLENKRSDDVSLPLTEIDSGVKLAKRRIAGLKQDEKQIVSSQDSLEEAPAAPLNTETAELILNATKQVGQGYVSFLSKFIAGTSNELESKFILNKIESELKSKFIPNKIESELESKVIPSKIESELESKFISSKIEIEYVTGFAWLTLQLLTQACNQLNKQEKKDITLFRKWREEYIKLKAELGLDKFDQNEEIYKLLYLVKNEDTNIQKLFLEFSKLNAKIEQALIKLHQNLDPDKNSLLIQAVQAIKDANEELNQVLTKNIPVAPSVQRAEEKRPEVKQESKPLKKKMPLTQQELEKHKATQLKYDSFMDKTFIPLLMKAHYTQTPMGPMLHFLRSELYSHAKANNFQFDDCEAEKRAIDEYFSLLYTIKNQTREQKGSSLAELKTQLQQITATEAQLKEQEATLRAAQSSVVGMPKRKSTAEQEDEAQRKKELLELLDKKSELSEQKEDLNFKINNLETAEVKTESPAQALHKIIILHKERNKSRMKYAEIAKMEAEELSSRGRYAAAAEVKHTMTQRREALTDVGFDQGKFEQAIKPATEQLAIVDIRKEIEQAKSFYQIIQSNENKNITDFVIQTYDLMLNLMNYPDERIVIKPFKLWKDAYQKLANTLEMNEFSQYKEINAFLEQIETASRQKKQAGLHPKEPQKMLDELILVNDELTDVLGKTSWVKHLTASDAYQFVVNNDPIKQAIKSKQEASGQVALIVEQQILPGLKFANTSVTNDIILDAANHVATEASLLNYDHHLRRLVQHLKEISSNIEKGVGRQLAEAFLQAQRDCGDELLVEQRPIENQLMSFIFQELQPGGSKEALKLYIDALPKGNAVNKTSLNALKNTSLFKKQDSLQWEIWRTEKALGNARHNNESTKIEALEKKLTSLNKKLEQFKEDSTPTENREYKKT